MASDESRAPEGRREEGPRTSEAPATRGPPTYPEEEVSLLDLAAVLLRHRRVIAGLGLAVPVLVVLATLLLPRSWSSAVSFMPQAATEGARSRLATLAGQFGLDVPSGEAGRSPQFYADLVRSREILGRVADDTVSVSDTTGLFARGRVRGTLPRVLELAEGEPGEVRRAAAVRWLRDEALSIATGRETGVVEVSVTTRWPELSARIAGRLVELVNDFNLERRQSQAAAERRFIEGRVEDAQANLRAAENALQSFLQNNRQFQNSPELVFEHDRLQRAVAMRQQVYTSLVQAREEARIDEVRNTPVITVVERAEVPVRPDRRRLPLKAALGLLVGGTLGILVSFGREYARRRREAGEEDFVEFSVVWERTKADLRSVVAAFRRS